MATMFKQPKNSKIFERTKVLIFLYLKKGRNVFIIIIVKYLNVKNGKDVQDCKTVCDVKNI